MTKTYSELVKRNDFLARYEYLKIGGELGQATFGYDRPINQEFYHSYAWKSIRDFVIVRDQGRDLGVLGYEIHDKILVHHMNPIRSNDLVNFNESILDPEFLICVSHRTHNAIHYGDQNQLPRALVERIPGDTKLW